MTKNRRNLHGSSISEFGPALLILFVIMIFPMIGLMYMGSAFTCGYFLNQLVMQELVTHSPDQAGRAAAFLAAKQKIDNSIFAKFLKVDDSNPPRFTVSEESAGSSDFVNLEMKLSVPPFVSNSPAFFGSVPGLTAPMELSFSDRRQQEEKGTAHD